MSKHENVEIRVPVELGNPSIKRIESLCIRCGKCRDVCCKDISVGQHYDLLKTEDTAICIHCGQCVNVCPTGSLVEVQDFMKVHKEIQNPQKKVVFMTSPSVRVALGEAFGKQPGAYLEAKMVGCLRALGADYVFDTTFAADLTIMEEASELIDRIIHQKPLPQFTSCCPAWVKFVETYYPEHLPNLSTAKSPIGMFGPTIKEYFAKQENIAREDIVTVALTPCTAKKFEIAREEIQDVDYVITTKELANWLKAENMDIDAVADSDFDQLMKRGSGAGIIFGNTGGVMEAALRSAYYFLTKESPPEDFFDIKRIRNMDGIKTATLTIHDLSLKVAVIHGTDNARRFIDEMQTNNEHYDFVEVMTCRGGCIGGGGQPKQLDKDMDDIRKARIQGLAEKDANVKIRLSHENPDIKQIYETFYGKPLSEQAEALLHTTYHARDDLHEDPKNYASQYQTILQEIIKKPTSNIKYKCSICGYIYEGDITKEADDYTCPICFVPKELFEIVSPDQEKTESASSNLVRYKCTICGYIYEGDLTQEPDDYKCPICFVPKDMFEKL